MGLKILYGILIALGIFIVITLIRAIFFVPKKRETKPLEKENVDVERVAKDELLSGIPEKMRKYYDSVLLETEEENELWKYVKAADKLSALIKCLEEEQMGNSDFADAKLTIEEYLKNMNMKEVDFFMEKFLPAYSMTLDESVTRLEG